MITDSLRALCEENKKRGSDIVYVDDVLQIADSIDSAADLSGACKYNEGFDDGAFVFKNKSNDKLAEHGLFKLPVDADGEFVKCGDYLDQFGTPVLVFALAINEDENMAEVIDSKGTTYGVRLRKMRHWKGYVDDEAFSDDFFEPVQDMLDRFIKLPEDADGKPWHFGDTFEHAGELYTVNEFTFSNVNGWVFRSGSASVLANHVRHYVSSPAERIRKLANELVHVHPVQDNSIFSSELLAIADELEKDE